MLGRRRSRVDLTADRRRVSALLFGCVPCLRISASLAKQTLLEADQRGCEDAVHNDAAQADFAVHRGHECDKGECAAGMAWSPSRPVALRCFFSSLSARYPRAFDPICLCPRPALTMGLGRCNSISRTRITIWTPPSTSRCTFFPLLLLAGVALPRMSGWPVRWMLASPLPRGRRRPCMVHRRASGWGWRRDWVRSLGPGSTAVEPADKIAT